MNHHLRRSTLPIVTNEHEDSPIEINWKTRTPCTHHHIPSTPCIETPSWNSVRLQSAPEISAADIEKQSRGTDQEMQGAKSLLLESSV